MVLVTRCTRRVSEVVEIFSPIVANLRIAYNRPTADEADVSEFGLLGHFSLKNCSSDDWYLFFMLSVVQANRS
jgi:hypothetical protein